MTLAGDLATVDPVAEALAHLRADPNVLAAFGSAEHISGLPEAPWPHLRITDGEGGDLRQLRWDVEFEILLECYGAPLGRTSETDVRRLLLTAMQSILDMPERDYTPGRAVVCAVEPSGVLLNQKLDNGQYRITAGMAMVMHPATT